MSHLNVLAGYRSLFYTFPVLCCNSAFQSSITFLIHLLPLVCVADFVSTHIFVQEVETASAFRGFKKVMGRLPKVRRELYFPYVTLLSQAHLNIPRWNGVIWDLVFVTKAAFL